jgi:hypothetical protein
LAPVEALSFLPTILGAEQALKLSVVDWNV